MKIGIFDSGKGGLSVFEEIKKVLPNEEYKYIGDSKNCPYGEKTDEELMIIVKKIVDELKEWGAQIIVIACNTATTRCIKQLRKDYPELEFVGTEPAIKLAADTGLKEILVMATPGTIKSERLESLLEKYQKSGQKYALLACPGLADVVEVNEGIDEKLEELLNGVGKYDCVVLGCTHYSLIKDRIKKYFPDAEVIDGNIGVANRTKSLVARIKNPL